MEMNIEVRQTAGEIACNFDEVKAQLQEQVKAYENLVITEDDIKPAKNDLANLRKIRKSFDDRRKEVKTEFMKPYEEFEKRAKELLEVIDNPIGMIDGKLKEFDKKRVEEKQAHLRELYEQEIGEFADYVPFESVKKPQWDNATYTDKDIIFDVNSAKTKIIMDLDAIKALQSEIMEECVKAYKAAGNDLSAAIKRNADYMADKQKIKEEADRKAKEEEERLREQHEQELREKIEKEIAEKEQTLFVDDIPIPEDLPFPVKEAVATFEIHGEENIEQVRQFLTFSEIEYKEI